MLQLVVKDLTTGEDILVAILLTEPGVDFGTSAAGGDVAQVRVQPVRLGFGCFWVMISI
jgi:hypothetical protein